MLDQKDLELLAGMINPINVQLGNINNRLDGIDARLDAVDARLDAMDVRFDEIDARFNRVENRLEMIDLKCDTNRKRLDDLSLDVKLAERDIRKDIKNLQDTTETLVVVLQGRGILPDPGNTIQTA
jgi:septation ring formation regulator EzrA